MHFKSSCNCFLFKDELEMQKDAISPGTKVIIVDDLLATGGEFKHKSIVWKTLQCAFRQISDDVMLSRSGPSSTELLA